MNIYFSCSLTGGRNEERIYGEIVNHLITRGHTVPTAHLADPRVMELEKIVVPREIYHRDIAWIEACDAIVAEVSTPSHGVGYEIAYALSIGKPVFCCYQEGVSVSKMLTGNDSSSFVIQAYTDTTQALELLDSFLSEV